MSKKSKLKFETAIKRLSNQQYHSILLECEVDKIQLKSLNVKLLKGYTPGEYEMSIKLDHDYYCNDDMKGCVFTSKLSLSIIESDSSEELLKMSAEYDVVLKTEQKLTMEFAVIYKKVTLPLNIWPYLRELTSNLSFRLGTPPITLPLLKIGD
jgi:hypothetical protein